MNAIQTAKSEKKANATKPLCTITGAARIRENISTADNEINFGEKTEKSSES